MKVELIDRGTIKIQLFRSCGFEIEELIELQPPEESDETRYAFVDLTWANKWPAEEAWIVRKNKTPGSVFDVHLRGSRG